VEQFSTPPIANVGSLFYSLRAINHITSVNQKANRNGARTKTNEMIGLRKLPKWHGAVYAFFYSWKTLTTAEKKL